MLVPNSTPAEPKARHLCAEGSDVSSGEVSDERLAMRKQAAVTGDMWPMGVPWSSPKTSIPRYSIR